MTGLGEADRVHNQEAWRSERPSPGTHQVASGLDISGDRRLDGKVTSSQPFSPAALRLTFEVRDKMLSRIAVE